MICQYNIFVKLGSMTDQILPKPTTQPSAKLEKDAGIKDRLFTDISSVKITVVI